MVVKVLPHAVHWSKRLFDITISAIALILLSPVILLVALAIIVFDGRPVFFKQERPGLKGEVFQMYKFRTMKCPKKRGRQLPADRRISKLGAILRKTSLDELPELWNVLRGEMSLVGPRPLLVRYLKRYDEEQLRRHDVLPGITGWAQINGRNVQSWEQRFNYDIWYVDNWSFLLESEDPLQNHCDRPQKRRRQPYEWQDHGRIHGRRQGRKRGKNQRLSTVEVY